MADLFRMRSDATTTTLSTVAATLSFLTVSGTSLWPRTGSPAIAVSLLILNAKNGLTKTLLSLLTLSGDERTVAIPLA